MTDGRRIAILGATGSIGVATLDVVACLQQHAPADGWQVQSVSGHSRIESLIESVAAARPMPQTIVVSDEKGDAADRARELIARHDLGRHCRLDVGPEALVRAATDENVDTVVAGIVGRAGLESTLAAVQAGKRVGLANKETLVIAGPVVTQAAALSGSELLPIDSEHSAIYQCLAEARYRASADNADKRNRLAEPSDNRLPGVRRLILTASGGPFLNSTAQEMREATPAQALNHPTWEMGRKITIDSATMMNKSLEIIEAKWLFDVPADSIEVVVHPQSIIHSLVEFHDGSVIAQLSPPDMRLPIQYALTYPDRLPCPAPVLDRDRRWDMSLIPVDIERFPALELGFEVARVGGTAGAVLNGANEAAVPLFLSGKIRFTDIAVLCKQTLLDHHHESSPSLERLLALDTWARNRATELAEKLAVS